MKKIVSLFILTTLICISGFSQLTVNNTNLTPQQLVQQVLVGNGVTISNVQFNGTTPNAQAVQTQVGQFNGTASNLNIGNGIVMGTGDVTLAEGPNVSGSSTNNNGVVAPYTDPDLTTLISPNSTNGEAVLEFDFIPQGDSIQFQYVFGSEEYNEFVNAGYNDAFGFFISGPGINGPFSNNAENIALIPGTTTPVTIDNVNNGLNAAFYNDNSTTGTGTVEYDGFTDTLIAAASVQCGQTYHIKLAISDAGDNAWDSGVFLQAGSFSSEAVDVTIQTVSGDSTVVEGCAGASFWFERPGDISDSLTVNFDISGTATNGTDYPNVADSVIFAPGEDSVEININPIDDGITEGPESITFTVYIINACGDTIESEGTIWIIDEDPVTVEVADTTLNCPEDSIPLVANVTDGIPGYTYQWGNGTMNDTTWVPGDQTGTYNVQVTDFCGSVGDTTATVTYNAPPPLSIVFNSNTFDLCPGESATATVVNVVNAQGSLTYNWATGATSQSVTEQMPSGVTDYYLSVTVDDGCSSVTDSVKLTVSEVDIDQINVTDASDCPPNAGANDGSIDVITNPSTGMTFDLSGGGNNYSNTSGNFNNLAGGINYFLTVTGPNGCFTDTIVEVDVLNNPTTFNGPINIMDLQCFGDDNGEAEITNINDGPTGAPYTIIWENQNGTMITETVGSAGLGDMQDTLGGGTWTVTVLDDGGCPSSEVFDIEEPDELIADITVDGPVICHNQSNGSIDLNATGGNGLPGSFDFQWSNGATTEDLDQIPGGTYSVIVTDQNGCQSMDTAVIDNPPALDVTVQTTPALCNGANNGSMQVIVNEAQGSQNNWTYELQPAGTNSNINSHLGAGSYTMQFTDSTGCDTIISFNITEPPAINYDITTDPALCRASGAFPGNGSVSATNVSGGVGNYSYVWTDGVDSTNTPTWGQRPAGEYYLTIRDGNGCPYKDTVFLDSLNPQADFTVDPIWGVAPIDSVDIENTSENLETNNASYTWSIDNWVTSVTDSTYAPDTSFANTGTYEICLKVTNVYNCVDSICKYIRVVPPLNVSPPNIFTPNGDGTNDIFHLNVSGATVFQCKIFNRWGQEIYSWTDPSAGWNGDNNNGKAMPAGIYFYQYEVAGQDGNVYTGQGSFNLVRD